MSDDAKTPEQIAAETAASDQGETKTVEQLEKEFAEKEARFKAELAGMNKAVASQKKINDDLLAKTLSAEELATKKLNETLAEAENNKLEALKYKRDLIIDKTLNSAGIPLEFAKRIIGETEEEIAEDVKSFKSFIDSEIKKGVLAVANQRFAGKEPATGSQAAIPTLQSAYDEAKKVVNIALMTAIQRQARKDGETLNI